MFKNLNNYIDEFSIFSENDEYNQNMRATAAKLALEEIERNLFLMPDADKPIYVDRVLYYLFLNKRHIISTEIGDNELLFETLIEHHKKTFPFSRFDLNDIDEEYLTLSAIKSDIDYFKLTMVIFADLMKLISAFSIKYDANKYPIKEFLKLKPEIDDIISKNKKFEDYLHHDNKEELLEVLRTLFDGKKGKDVAVIILALQELGIIYIGNRNELYRSMRAEFGDIGSSSGINDYLKKEYIMRSEIDNAKRIIEN